ncbi:MAG: diacylglycerol kinase family protein [Cyanobacteria bacterium J06623_7]
MEQNVVFTSKLAQYPELPKNPGILTKESLFWQEQGIKQRLSLADVVGTSAIAISEKAKFGLLISAYPRQTAIAKRNQRELAEYYFVCEDEASRAQWQQAIDNTLAGKPIEAELERRRLQVVINPNSGRQKAGKIFQQGRQVFDRANLEYDVIETTSTQETKSSIFNLNLDQLEGLVIVGGDGTVHDAIAALMSRPDRDRAIKLPLGIIPGGTGNGLCKSILAAAGEAYSPLNAAFIIAKGKQQDFDLATVRQNEKEYYSFLSLAWGLISDVDIESEKLKFLGAYRFDLYALILMSLLRDYRGRFTYLPHPDCQHFQADKADWQTIEADFIFLWGMNTPWAAHDMNVTPKARLNDGAIDVLVMRRGTSRLELLQALIKCGKGQHLDLPHMEYYKVRAFKLKPLTDRGILVVDGEPVDYSPVEMEVMPGLARVYG